MNKTISPFVSIIIPLHVISQRFFDDLDKFQLLKWPRYEIIIVSDIHIVLPKNKYIRLIVTGKKSTGPAEKRDIGAKFARGEISAFIDDDAYPDPLWITKAIRHFIRNKDIIAVGGPGVTPHEDSRMAKLGGLVYESEYTSGGLKIRFESVGTRIRNILDWPAYNLFIRTKVIKKVGGWGSTFYGGEDTFICLKMLKHGRMIYDPKVVVNHHRRPLFYPHLKQIFNIGVHRGYFFKKYPETSRQVLYLYPTTLTIGFWTLFILSFFNLIIFGVFFLACGIFFAIAFSSVLNKKDLFGTIIASFGIFMSHMSYGIGFMKGLSTENLVR